MYNIWDTVTEKADNFQMISSEFDEWNKVLEGLEKWLQEKNNERSWEQFKHSKV